MSSSLSDRLRRTVGFRLALWYAALFVASAIVLVGLTYLLLSSSLARRDHEIIRSTLVRYAGQYEQGGLEALNSAIQTDTLAGRHGPLFVRVLGPDEEAVFSSMPADWPDFDVSQLPSTPPANGSQWTDLAGPGDVVLEVDSVQLPDGTLFQVGKSTASRDEILRRFRAVLSIALLVMLAIGLTGGAVLTRSALAPIRRLIQAVRTIIQTGRLRARVPAGGTGDAIDELGALFNGMLDRIESLIAGMRGSLDNVAHDLRTPMMRLRGTAEMALQAGGPDACREALTACVEESDQVIAMLDTLMDISEAETGVMKLQRDPVDVATLLGQAAELYADVAEDRGITLAIDVPAGLTVMVDRNRMRQVLANLLDNAVKYTPAGGRIALEAAPVDGRIRLIVRDTGAGIAAHEIDRIWDRLYRGDTSRSERGLGLGLSLVKAIVLAHGGSVDVHSEPGHGSEFIVSLPQT